MFTLIVTDPMPNAEIGFGPDGTWLAEAVSLPTMDAIGEAIFAWLDYGVPLTFTVDGEPVVVVTTSGITGGLRVETTRLYLNGRAFFRIEGFPIPAAHVPAGAKPGPWCGICSDPDHTTDECFSEDS